MELETFKSRVLSNPYVKKLALEVEEKKTAVEEAIKAAVYSLGLRHNFDFCMGEYDIDSVAGQSDYVVSGLDDIQDVLDVVNVRYGDSLVLLEKLRATYADRLMSGRGDSTFEVTSWVPAGRSGPSPVIRLIGSPSDDGEIIRVRYRKRQLDIEMWPDELLFVVESAAIARLDAAYKPIFESDLAIAVSRFDSKTPDRDPVRIDEEVISNNIRRNNLYGFR